MARPKPSLTFYFRGNESGLHIRDLYGGHDVATMKGNTWSARAFATAMPWYNRIAFHGRRRFTAGPARDLPSLFTDAGAGEILDSPQVALPSSRQNSRRVAGQGMAKDAAALFAPVRPQSRGHLSRLAQPYTRDAPPDRLSATQYAERLGIDGKFEWCHLIAKSMGGGDGKANVVAGTAHNNSEQLIVENLLAAYAREQLFSVQVSARLLNSGVGQYMGLAIRYTISDPRYSIVKYLDCQAQRKPTKIHLDVVMESIARWLNQELVINSVRHVTPEVIQQFLRDCPDYAEDPEEIQANQDDDDMDVDDDGDADQQDPSRKRKRGLIPVPEERTPARLSKKRKTE